MIKACIFDLDGTLADTLKSIAYNANEAISKFGFKPHPISNYKYYAGDGADMLLKRSLIAAGDKELKYFLKVKESYRVGFEKNCMYKVKPFEGILELLNKLKAKGIKLAVLSNKPHPRTLDVIYTLFGEELFDIVLGQSDDIKKKPSPDGAFYIAKRLNVLPSECVYVGDTDTDMMTGTGAGMYTVGVLWGFRDRAELEENGASIIVDKPSDILNIFER